MPNPLNDPRGRRPWQPTLFGAAAGWLVGLSLAVSPVGLSTRANVLIGAALILLGASIGEFAWHRVAGWAAVIAGAILAIVLCTPLMDGVMVRSVRRDPTPTTPVDAVVVLSAGLQSDGLIDETGIERLISGLHIMRANHAPLLVTTHIAAVDHPGVNSDADQRAIVSLAIDTAQWRAVRPVETTRTEALATAKLLAPATSHAIAVVTSPMHARRACATFEAVGFRVSCMPAEERRYALRDLHGARQRLRALFDWTYERVGWMKYSMRGWVR
jgi:uncharacterized SAM-binding protein YcdF (DUF218 family)